MELQKIKNFFRPLYGYGSGSGDGYGSGSGDGYGSGSGDGYGSGYGYGSGDGVKYFNKQKVYIIDNTQTIINNIKGDIATGYILGCDLLLTKCFIVRNDSYYAHGHSLREALKSLESKTLLGLPIEKRIENFKHKFKSFNKKYNASVLYEWHYKLTGSCKIGRDIFCSNHNINLKKDKFTIFEFIELTKKEYGSEIILKLNTY